MSYYILSSVPRSVKKRQYTPIISKRVHCGEIASDGIESLQMSTVSRENLPGKKLVCTCLNSHRDGRKGEKRLGQYVSSRTRRDVVSEVAGCLSGTEAGFGEKYALGPDQ